MILWLWNIRYVPLTSLFQQNAKCFLNFDNNYMSSTVQHLDIYAVETPFCFDFYCYHYYYIIILYLNYLFPNKKRDNVASLLILKGTLWSIMLLTRFGLPCTKGIKSKMHIIGTHMGNCSSTCFLRYLEITMYKNYLYCAATEKLLICR